LEQVYLNPSFLVLLSILLIATFVNPMGQVSQYAAQGNYIDKPLFRHALIFTVFSFIIANSGLNKIISLSIPVLMFLYPLAITLIILSLLAPIIKKQKHIYRWTTTLTMIAAFFDFIKQAIFRRPYVTKSVVTRIVNIRIACHISTEVI
jgi:branched-subunit amino acid permease